MLLLNWLQCNIFLGFYNHFHTHKSLSRCSKLYLRVESIAGNHILVVQRFWAASKLLQCLSLVHILCVLTEPNLQRLWSRKSHTNLPGYVFGGISPSPDLHFQTLPSLQCSSSPPPSSSSLLFITLLTLSLKQHCKALKLLYSKF